MINQKEYPLITIITVSFNSGKTVGRTIKSILNQSYHNVEYLFIDGASTDNTVAIAESYRESFSKKGYKYVIVSEKDDGLYYAMNKGIDMAHGKIIGIVNSDDWYENDAAEIAVGYYMKHPYDILMCSMNRCKAGKVVSRKSPNIRRYKSSMDFCHPSMFVTKNTYEQIGKYDTSVFYADFDFWLRQFKENVCFVTSKSIVTNFTLGGVSNQKSFSKMMMRIKDRYHVYRKNHYSRFYVFESIFIEVAKVILA